MIWAATWCQSVYAWYRLRHIKGPWHAGWSQLWLMNSVSSGNMHWKYAKVCEKHGGLARVGPNFLVTNDPDQMRKMLAARSPYLRSDWYTGMKFDPSRDNITSERNEKRHTELRAKLALGYSGKEVPHLEAQIDENIANFIVLLNKYVSTPDSDYKPFDFARKTQYFTLDIITHIAFGKTFGYLATDSDLYGYIKAVEETMGAAMMVTVLPWINWVLQTRLMKRVMPDEKDPIGFGKVLGIAKAVVAQRFGPGAKARDDMLGSFIKHGLTAEEAQSEIVVQIIAGSDTTAIAIRIIVLYLITTPRVLSKFRAEYSRASISSPITDAEARNLPYLQAIIKEGLRIWPPIVGLQAKLVPPGGDVINGHFVPARTKIGTAIFGIMRNKKVFGEDADVFRPERWLDAPPEKIKQREQTVDLVFGAGRFKCLGNSVALIELNKIFIELFKRFDFASVDPQKPIGSIEAKGIFTIRDFWITATRREDE
ncbi:cytochrome P450 [Stipitochalara longipes BDJ]|nr:cytochrome P450 [Stipitochalara longipes BDJ]